MPRYSDSVGPTVRRLQTIHLSQKQPNLLRAVAGFIHRACAFFVLLPSTSFSLGTWGSFRFAFLASAFSNPTIRPPPIPGYCNFVSTYDSIREQLYYTCTTGCICIHCRQDTITFPSISLTQLPQIESDIPSGIRHSRCSIPDYPCISSISSLVIRAWDQICVA